MIRLSSTAPTPASSNASPADTLFLSPHPATPSTADGAARYLEVASDALTALPDGPEVRLVGAATNALVDTFNWIRRGVGGAADAARRLTEDALKAELAAIASSLALTGEERGRREAEARARAAQLAADGVVTKLQPEADRLAANVVGKLEAARIAVAKAIARATGPLSQSAPLTLESSLKISALREEAAAWRPEQWTAYVRGCVERNDDAAELVGTLAFQPLANATMTANNAKLSATYGYGGAGLTANELGMLRATAQDFLQFLAARQEEKVPEVLRVLPVVLAHLQEAFSFLLGWAVVWLTRGELEQRFATGSTPPTTVHPAWLRRFVDVAIASRTGL